MKHMRMAVIALALLAGLQTQAQAGVYKAPLENVMLLPQYCWGQYDNKFRGAQYGISRSLCGVGMNHYCPGLLLYQKAQVEPDSGKRAQLLKRTLGAIEYTLKWMQDYPNCPIRGDVLQMQNQVRMGLGMPPLLNETPPPAPQVSPDAPDTGTAQGNVPTPGGAAAQGNGQGASAAGDQLYPAPKIPPRDDSKIGMPGDPYCRFCPD